MPNVKLIGEEAEGSEAEAAHNPEISKAFQFITGSGGYGDTFHIKFSATGTGTSCKLGIFTDSGATKPAKLLVEAEITSIAAGEHSVEIPITYLAPKTKYWLALLPLGGTVKIKIGAIAAKSISKEKRLTLAANLESDWEAAANNAPMSIWVTGERYAAVYPVYPPTFQTPMGRYKQFPPSSSEFKIAVEEFTGVLKQTTAFSTTSPGFKQAEAGIKQTTALSQKFTALKETAGSLVQKTAFSQKITSLKVAAGNLVQNTAFSQKITSLKVGIGSLVQTTAFSQKITSLKVASAAVIQQVAITTKLSGLKQALGSLKQTTAYEMVILSREEFIGAITQAAAFSTKIVGQKVASASVRATVAVSGSQKALKVASSALKQTFGAQTGLKGLKTATGALKQAAAFVQRLLGEITGEPHLSGKVFAEINRPAMYFHTLTASELPSSFDKGTIPSKVDQNVISAKVDTQQFGMEME